MRPLKFDRPGRLFARDIAAVLITLFAVSSFAAGTQQEGAANALNGAATAAAPMSSSAPSADPGSATGPLPLSFSTGRLRNGGAHRGKIDASGMPASKQRGVTSFVLGSGVYVYDADAALYFDEDDDGFFSGLDVVFDVDTIYPIVDVYARLYLSYEGGPWEAYFTTDMYVVAGATADDEYVVETELFSAYPRGYYDILIEIYDADDYLVASFGPGDSSAVSVLPLEDAERDAPYVPPLPVVVALGGGGGALGPLWLLMLVALVTLREVAARRQAICRPGTVRRRMSAPTAGGKPPAWWSPGRSETPREKHTAAK